ncbi:protein Skeletor, isoforms B/C-like [Uloborus diversus]|uniref:protein Skeletor, isoforms B/C-like n=1 Tax=Uloborus diversus TaxID=327109 RepID=UPI00240A5308|nr:protein Skeletor, isoforms B/C-like [Uloborus diversus]
MNFLRMMKNNSSIFLLLIGVVTSVPYYGARIGKFSTHFHDVRGEVYAVDDKTLFIKGFNYDGKGQDAVFWSGNSIRPDTTGFIIPNHKASFQPLSQYNNQDLILRLPEGKKVNDIHWLSVWSKKHSTSFGTLIFPKSLVPPRPVVIGPLVNTKKGVSSGDILVLDTQTFLIPDFSYDGSGKGTVKGFLFN